MNINNDGLFASNTPIGEKINKIERQIGKGKLRLLDNDRNPLVSTSIVESESEVEVVFDETANLRILTSGKDGSEKGYDTNSLLEQWTDSYPDNDDYDLYDDDMYENQNIYELIEMDYSPIPILAHHDIYNPDELCKTEGFPIIRYSMGTREEFITVGPSKISTVEKTPDNMSRIYHELFNKKDRGWTITCTK
nr:hypothetical protein [Tanacetum cinerariifolium]